MFQEFFHPPRRRELILEPPCHCPERTASRIGCSADWQLSAPPATKVTADTKASKPIFDAASRVFKTRRIHVACAPMAALALAWAVMDAAALENELYSTVSDKQVPEFDGKKSRLGTIPSWWKDTTGFIIDTTWYYNTWEYTYIYIYICMWTLPPILKPVINEASNQQHIRPVCFAGCQSGPVFTSWFLSP